MMRISKIEIEGMHNVDRKVYDFDDLTYLHGPNGAGKSTVLQAIQLALLGYIPGENKASKEAIFRHSNGRILQVTLHIKDDDRDISICRGWTGTKTSINSYVDINPDDVDLNEIIEDIELPIFNFNEFMNLTANKMKDWFINFLPSADMEIDWKTELTESANEAGINTDDPKWVAWIDEVIGELAKVTGEGSDLVRNINEKFKSDLSFTKKELERATSTIQSLIYYDDVDTSKSLDEIKADIKLYESLKTTRDNTAKALADNAKIMDQLKSYDDCESDSAELDPRYIKLSKSYSEASDKIIESQNNISKIQSELLDIQATSTSLVESKASLTAENKAKQKIVDSEGICPYTNAKCESVQKLLQQYIEEIATNDELVDNLTNDINECNESIANGQKTINEMNNLINSLTQQKFDFNSQMSEIQDRYRRKQQLKTAIVIVPDMDDDDRDFDALIDELRDLEVKIKANEQYSNLIDTLTANKYELDQKINAYKAWITLTGVNGLQNDASALSPFLDLQADIDEYLQAVFGEDIFSKFNLVAKANSFSFGITRNDEYIPFNLLSSGEKCMYTLALMMSLTKVSKSPLSIVMVDDLLDHLDDVNIVKMFDSLKSVNDIQMIFAGVKSLEGDFVVEVTK